MTIDKNISEKEKEGKPRVELQIKNFKGKN